MPGCPTAGWGSLEPLSLGFSGSPVLTALSLGTLWKALPEQLLRSCLSNSAPVDSFHFLVLCLRAGSIRLYHGLHCALRLSSSLQPATTLPCIS